MDNFKKQNDILLNQVKILKAEIQNLNENTIIESMKDMKEQYEKLNRESVSIEIYEDLLFQRKMLLKLIGTTEMINNLNLQKISNIAYYIENYNQQDTDNKSKDKLSKQFTSICEKDLANITNNCKLIQEFINNNDDNECQCDSY